MSKDFVIDENVVRNAWHGKKPDKSDALAEQKFMHDVFYGKQHISASEKIRSKIIQFHKKTEKIKDDVNVLLIPMYLKILFNSQRTTIHTPIKTDFVGIKDCDSEFVGVTIKSQGILVTADKKLKDAIANDSNLKNCECKTVEEIIEKQS